MEVERAHNGGFPEPLAGEAVRLVRCTHAACGTATRVRVPQALPARAVRRVVCDGCSRAYDCGGAHDDGVVATAAGSEGRGWSQGRAWKYLSVPLAAAAVIAALILLQGGGGEPEGQSTSSAPAAPAGGAAAAKPAEEPKSGQGGELVKGSSYTLALPDGWKQTTPDNDATFAATAKDGGAEANLWVRRDPSLSFTQFQTQSLSQLSQATGREAKVVDSTTAPTPEGTVVTLAADSPSGAPDYEVTLRSAGPYRYYLATTVEPDASKTAADGAELIRSSFVPVATGKSG